MLPLHQWCLLNGGALSQIIVYYFYRSNKKLKRRGRMCASPNKHYFDKHRQNNVSDFLDFQEIPSFISLGNVPQCKERNYSNKIIPW
jgi:hypothetical protein